MYICITVKQWQSLHKAKKEKIFIDVNVYGSSSIDFRLSTIDSMKFDATPRLTTGWGTSAETCGLDDVFPPDDLGSRPKTLC